MENVRTRQSKVPKKSPIFLVKGIWAGTACFYKVTAKDNVDAKDRAWKLVAKTQGGDHCLKVVVLHQI